MLVLMIRCTFSCLGVQFPKTDNFGLAHACRRHVKVLIFSKSQGPKTYFLGKSAKSFFFLQIILDKKKIEITI